ncbi:glycosyltransferase [Hyphomicrobium sp. 99]|uniref:glycosyltransferase family 2 protein n=1 Tax=Hyphomicrobium sp. 99 TaxID=1163419 RepID=UPI0018CF4373|nr:glycosyltransferase family 2 protein [Hyphomicrobium sp. 99]
MPVYNTPEKYLREAIESVKRQLYENWQLCIADDCSTVPHVRALLESYAAGDPRIKVVFRTESGHIASATNSAFALADGEWIALVDHDDVLREHALAEVAFEISRYPEAELIYSDEDKLDADDQRYDPYFKPDFSRELFRSQNYLNHLTVHRARNIRAVGGWRSGYDGSQDYDLSLRIFERVDQKNIRHIPKILYHWRAAEGSAASSVDAKNYAYSAGLRALEEHVERIGLAAKVEPAPNTPFYRMRLELPNPNPRVSLIIPTRDKVDLLRACVNSIRDKTTYGNYELIIVDNGSRDLKALQYLAEIQGMPHCRVLRFDGPFNYSAINNFAVEHSDAPLIGLINNDVDVISPEWLTEMASWAMQPDIGCVGAKLYYPDGTLQHGGVIMGIGRVSGHSHKHFPRDHAGYFCRLRILQNLSAVTGACLVVRREIFKEVGGLDDKNLPVSFNDVDFCLKVRAAGYFNVWTPYAELYHLESVSRGSDALPQNVERARRETAYMRSKWRSAEEDPYYSVNLTKDFENFGYR